MNNFIKYPLRKNAKNFRYVMPFESFSFTPKTYFSSVESPPQEAKQPEKMHKYSDRYDLSQEEIQNILRKPKQKPNVFAKTEVERADIKAIYEKSIEEQIGTARFNTVKEFNTKLEASQTLEITPQDITPSDRPGVKYYKYGLPIPNIDPEIEGLDDIFEREAKKRVTVNQKIWDRLELGADVNFESYEKGLQRKFNFGKLKYYIL